MQTEVATIYRSAYWDSVRADDFPAPLDLVLFDSAVQHGVGTASKWLQHVVGTNADGKIGPRTIANFEDLIGGVSLRSIIYDYIAMREDFYNAIIERHPDQAVFAKGWNNRLQALKDEVDRMT